MNDLVLEGKFPRYPPLAIFPGDVESDPANYDDDHHLKESCELEPSELKLYKGMQVNMTKNNRKDIDFVNGMRGEVLGWHGVSKSVRVKTRVGHIVDVWPWSDPDLDDLTYYPLRPGYASTLLKFHGAELPRVLTFQVQPTQASTCDDFLLSGKLNVMHFQPVR